MNELLGSFAKDQTKRKMQRAKPAEANPNALQHAVQQESECSRVQIKNGICLCRCHSYVFFFSLHG
jgi:hypothetical protein